MKDLLTFVLAGGEGKRLHPLTARRAKPAVPFAGRRLIDFTLANAARSELRKVVVLTQYRAQSVERHVRRAYSGRVEIFSAAHAGRAFTGTADAVRAALEHYPRGGRVLVLAGDHVYRMDYRRLLTAHLVAQAEATLSAVPVTREEARGLGVLDTDKGGRVVAFREKPHDPPPDPLASMGIYIFERDPLAEFLAAHPEAADFGLDVLPGMLQEGYRLQAHFFPDTWCDIADVDAYYAAHRPHMRGPDGSFLGHAAHVAPGARVEESILLDGASVGRGARLSRVIVEEGVRIPAGARIGFDPLADASHGYVTAEGVTVVCPQPARGERVTGLKP